MHIQVPYGRSTASAELPDRLGVDVVERADTPGAPDPGGEVRRALADPLGGFEWSDHEGARSVAIAVNDKTRPVPHGLLLPPLMERLEALGIADSAVTVHVAVGGHPPMADAELPDILPQQVIDRYRVVSHDAERTDDLVHLGRTSRGTPVWVSRAFAEAELRIVVGTIEPHQFVGFSGGVKSAAIGLAGLDTIERNHSLMTHPDSMIGTYATNPARRDVEEIGRIIGVDLALNTTLNHGREIVRVFAGDPLAVMEAGAPCALDLSRVVVRRRYGLVVSSPGGHPKDVNVYQAQKAVSAAARIVRPGGTIVLVAACPDGAGSRHYEDWVAQQRSREAVVEAFTSEGFHIGPHKAFQLARDTASARLIVCSEMPDELTRRLLLDPAGDLQDAIDRVVPELGPDDRVAVLPRTATALPELDGEMAEVGR